MMPNFETIIIFKKLDIKETMMKKGDREKCHRHNLQDGNGTHHNLLLSIK